MTSSRSRSATRLRMRRAASADRLNSGTDAELLSPTVTSSFKCSLAGFPYCCTKHYAEYRRWPYYLDPPGLGSYPAYRSRYWLGWPRYSYADYPYGYYYNYYYGDYRRFRPWYNGYGYGYVYGADDYYGDYLRGYAEGMRKYGDKADSSLTRLSDDYQKRRRRASAAAADQLLLSSEDLTGGYSRPYHYYGRYL